MPGGILAAMSLMVTASAVISFCPVGVRSALPSGNNTSLWNTNRSPTIRIPCRFASTALRLDDVKTTAKGLGITLNDVVLATAAGGLRQLLLRYDGKADRPIITSVPTATDKSDRVTGTEISGHTPRTWSARQVIKEPRGLNS